MAVTLVLGSLRQVATLSAPTVATSPPGPGVTADGDGGFTEDYQPLDPPTWRCAIEKASARASERRFAGTVTAHATHILTGRFHAGITTQTRVAWTDRAGTEHIANVLDVDDSEGAGVESVVLVSEVAP